MNLRHDYTCDRLHFSAASGSVAGGFIGGDDQDSAPGYRGRSSIYRYRSSLTPPDELDPGVSGSICLAGLEPSKESFWC